MRRPGESNLLAIGLLIFVTLAGIGCHKEGLLDTGKTQGTQSPIKVRGGAMTARTAIKGGWKSGGSGTYCSEANDVSWINFDEAAANSGVANPQSQLTAGWTVKILGRVYNGPGNDGPSTSGIILTSQANNCAGNDPKKFSILLSLVEGDGGHNVSFYQDSTTSTEDGSDARKFEDNSPGCTGPNGGTGEEDVCERASTITLTTKEGVISQYSCTNGECTVRIGQK